jgi:hypothetical protein
MNQASLVPFGTDASRLAGYAQTANERLGAIDFTFENTGSIAAYIKVMSYIGPTTTPSGYADVLPLDSESYNAVTTSPPAGTISGFTSVGPPLVVNARGCLTRSYNLLSKRVGFFGSGISATLTINGVSTVVRSTTVNITASIRNKGDIRGAQIDISQVGRQGWGYDQAFNTPNLTKKWGSIDPVTGIVSPTGNNYNEAAPS